MNQDQCCDTAVTNKKRNIQRLKPHSVKILNNTITSSCCCCGSSCDDQPITVYDKKDPWISGELQTTVGTIPQISTKLVMSDILGAWKVRWGIGRMSYLVNPGLYAIGTPDENSNVLVTANYKLTLDALRKELKGMNLWILVLDTKGVNVWCAAGKGTFGTTELINRITKSRLLDLISHKKIILPQLGAPGVMGYEVTKQTGFQIVYGPVRAEDVKVFINSGFKATEKMREVLFTTKDRLVLTPVEIVSSFKPSIYVFGAMFLLNLLPVNRFGIIDFYAYAGAVISGCFLTPLLLPWIPVKAFAMKGWILGLLWTISVIVINGWPSSNSFEILRGFGYLFALPSVSAYFAMNFTGSSTYTSYSGVLKEMKTAIPAILISIGLGIITLLINLFVIL